MMGASLSRKFAVALAAMMAVASLAFLMVFMALYRAQLEGERVAASEHINLLFQAALENAMLKRDLDGLSGIVERLGRQEGVRRVMILNPSGEVRFSSDPAELNRRHDAAGDEGCAPCHGPGGYGGRTLFMPDAAGGEVLRAVTPVRNREPCQQCHGPMADHPVNGVLVVDWEAGAIRDGARSMALLLIAAGGAVLVLMLGGIWVLMHRLVLGRLGQLGAAAARMAGGDMEAAAKADGNDEIAVLADTFNRMMRAVRERMREVRERQAFLQALIDAIPDGVRLLGPDHRVVMANRAYRRQLDLPDDAPVVGSLCFSSSHGQSDPCPPTMVACPLELLSRNPTPVKSVHTHRRADGSPLEVEVYAAPMTVEQDGESRTYLVESIRNLAEDVRFGHEQKLSAVGQLAAGVAHEIRNPLASIRLALQAILRGDAGSEVESYLRLVDGQIDKCIDVTARLLKLSASGADQRQLVDLNPAIAGTLSLLSYHAGELKIMVNLDLDPQEPRVLGSDSDLRMVFLNLAQNAFHAMPGGGRLLVRTRQGDDDIRIEFIDTGTGIPAELRRRIFEPFFSHRADGEGGTGLGLPICKSIIEDMGGSIQAESVWGEGSTFIVILPTAQAAMKIGKEATCDA